MDVCKGSLGGMHPAMSPAELAYTGLSISKALQILQAKGICHGDLKPDNVLLDWVDDKAPGAGHKVHPDFSVKLHDWDWARWLWPV